MVQMYFKIHSFKITMTLLFSNVHTRFDYHISTIKNYNIDFIQHYMHVHYMHVIMSLDYNQVGKVS